MCAVHSGRSQGTEFRWGEVSTKLSFCSGFMLLLLSAPAQPRRLPGISHRSSNDRPAGYTATAQPKATGHVRVPEKSRNYCTENWDHCFPTAFRTVGAAPAYHPTSGTVFLLPTDRPPRGLNFHKGVRYQCSHGLLRVRGFGKCHLEAFRTQPYNG